MKTIVANIATWLFRILFGAIFLFVCISNISFLEQTFFPVLDNQTITNITSDNKELCWSWNFEKNYPRKLSYIDFKISSNVILKFHSNAVNYESSQSPVSTTIYRPPGVYSLRFCMKYSDNNDPLLAASYIRIETLLTYQGFLSFYTVSVRDVPPVIFVRDNINVTP